MNLLLFSLLLIVTKCLASATEFRVKVGEVLEKLTYPNQLQNIKAMGSESVLKMAVDFDSTKGAPRLTQIALIPVKSALNPVVYGMEYKSASSKAVLNIDFAKILPGSVEAGAEYRIEAFLVGEKTVNWKLGSIKMPETVSTVLADVEDHFYPLPEIKPAPVIENNPKRSQYSIVYLVFSGLVLVPWIVLLNSWNSAGLSVKPDSSLFSNRVSVFTPLFTLGIVSLFSLVAASWISLSIFTQLASLAVLVPPTAFFGFKSFKAQLTRK